MERLVNRGHWLQTFGEFRNFGFRGQVINFVKAGNVLSVVLDDSLQYPGDATVSYTYDDLHRLTRETCVPSQGSYRVGYDYRYYYDALGNRTCKIEGEGSGRYETYYSYSARNELVSLHRWQIVEEWNEETEEWEEVWYYQGGYGYGYDLRGNLTAKSQHDSNWEEVYQWAYEWSSDDKMTRVAYGRYSDAPDHVVQYKYDLLGRRVAKKMDSGNWRWYFYDGLQVTAEGTGTSDKIYYTNSPGAIAGIICRDASTGGGEKLWYHFDRLGNVMAATNSDGYPCALYTMDAFGNILHIGNGGYYPSSGELQPYHLTTKEYDPDSGLYYFNAGWYDPTVGRCMSRSEMSIAQEHPYSFCKNNPVLFTDPSGRCPKKEACVSKDAGYCRDWLNIGLPLVGHPGETCYRQLKTMPWWFPFPEPVEHCCYANGELTGAHTDSVSPVRGREKCGDCKYNPGAIPVHICVDWGPGRYCNPLNWPNLCHPEYRPGPPLGWLY
jgi:RHS repeat-associated protein